MCFAQRVKNFHELTEREGAVKLIGHRLFTGPALPGAPEKRFAAGRTVVTFTFGPRPLAAAGMITEF